MNELIKLAAACILKKASNPLLNILMSGKPNRSHVTHPTDCNYLDMDEAMRTQRVIETLEQTWPAGGEGPNLASLIMHGTKDKSMINYPGGYVFAGGPGYEYY